MNEGNLRPEPIRTTERAKELGRLGGLVKSDAKKNAAKWREIKRFMKLGKFRSKNSHWLIERVNNSKAFAVDMMKDLDLIETKDMTPFARAKLLNLKQLIYRTIHGEKHKLEGNVIVPIQINIISNKTEEK